ncbi:methyl-accepting chemotaxis protein [Desulfovibrio psychrotolerans]|uniref:Methyl-accepting chemotaxis protein n=1 Tax=Desulfovibrio psychrotolerans TaxID=415242 RepID=A0A7J0BVE7_9BACT|nr:methyl-accepting chemotaxis protein [Desulfovibrio psychrotolerans]GFM36974.1 methyl-accepting chemotaxis protein [Desulfovibrio psychrotolerans]
MLKGVSVKALIFTLVGVVLAMVFGGFGWLWLSATGDVVAVSTVSVVAGCAVAALLFLILPLSVLLVQRITGPLREIRQGVERVLDGDYTVCFACGGSDELAEMRLALESLITRLKHNLGFAQGVLKGIDTPFVVVDTKEKLTYTNASLIKILQHDGKPEDYYGQNVAHFFYGDASRRTVLRDSLENHTVTAREVEFTGRKGGKRTLFIHASPLFDLNGELMGALCIYQDLTELRTREAEILAKNEAISRAAQESEGVSTDVARLAQEISAQVEHTSNEVDRQTERAIDTATAMEEMNAAVYEVARNASTAAEQATEARSKAQEGSSVVAEAMNAIAEVARQSEALRTSMGELGTRAEGIGQVMNVITDIADQTNLLALNAAIEAARAGEAGRGFAVVADEVRKLAEKTMTATKEVGSAIQAIQEGTRQNTQSVDSAVKAVERSRSLSAASGEALKAIVHLVNDTSDQVQAIATAAEQQSATSEHINQAVDEVKNISQQAAAELNAATMGIRELAKRSAQLREIIERIEN